MLSHGALFGPPFSTYRVRGPHYHHDTRSNIDRSLVGGHKGHHFWTGQQPNIIWVVCVCALRHVDWQLSLTLCLCPVLVWLPSSKWCFPNPSSISSVYFFIVQVLFTCSFVWWCRDLRRHTTKRGPLFLFIGFCRATTFKSRWRKMSFNSISQLKRLFQGGHHPKNCRHDLLFMQSCQAKAFRQSRGIFKGCTISAWFPLSVGGWWVASSTGCTTTTTRELDPNLAWSIQVYQIDTNNCGHVETLTSKTAHHLKPWYSVSWHLTHWPLLLLLSR